MTRLRGIVRPAAAAGLAALGCAAGGAAAAAPAPGGCPAWVPPPASAAAPSPAAPATVASTYDASAADPAVAFDPSAALVGPEAALVAAQVDGGGSPPAVAVQYWQKGADPVCTRVVHASGGQLRVALTGLEPATRYRYRFVFDGDTGSGASTTATFTTFPQGVVAQGVHVGSVSVGRLREPAARAAVARSVVAPLRLTYRGAYWRVAPARVGARVDASRAVAAALAAAPGSQLAPPRVAVDTARVRAYVASLARRWDRAPAAGGVALVGTHAVVTPKRNGVAVARLRMTAALVHQLTTGERTLLPLEVREIPAAAAGQQRAVVVRLSTQTLTAYLDGKPLLTAPVTTGRPALPTPIGSFKVEFRASPYVFHSPWPPGSAYWYPPTPVTWAMEFYDGDFLHDDPGEPANAFGSDSQNGYFASHGCVHVPHDTMAFLYGWLPVGAPVIVADH